MREFLDFVIVKICLLTLFFVKTKSDIQPKIFAILPTGKYVDVPLGDIPVFPSDVNVQMYVYGQFMSTTLQIGITDNDSCKRVAPAELTSVLDDEGKVGVMSFNSPSRDRFQFKKRLFHLCVLDPKLNKWVFQGSNNNISFFVYDPLLTPAFSIVIIILCYCLSSLMSGLNIGLMVLSPQELDLLKKVGTAKEKKYATKIIPVRKNGNYLLCSILLTATLCNVISTIYIDKFVSSEATIIITTVIIVLFCEIGPQIVCTYYPLSIGANTVYITKLCMILTAPVSYPLSMLLNCFLGKEIAAAHTKERLRELVKMTELPANEEKIIEGTLDMSQKRVEDVMTGVDNIFKLPLSGVMCYETIELILESGFSRIPIYVENELDIRYVLLTKDLALLDPDDNVPISALVEHSKIECKYIPCGITLDRALAMFKDSRWHMAFVVDQAFPIDKVEKRVLGLITFEDVLEEILQAEISDETDTGDDDKIKEKLLEHLRTKGLLPSQNTDHVETPSEHFQLGAFYFLSEIDKFSNEYLSRNILLKLLKMDILHTADTSTDVWEENIYVRGVPANYFVMILEGNMNVKIEDFIFEAGPFAFFGLEALKQDSLPEASLGFIPSFTLQATKKTMYIKISSVLYNAALLATDYERLKKVPDIGINSELYKYFNQLVKQSVK